jgi:hypothetical protein
MKKVYMHVRAFSYKTKYDSTEHETVDYVITLKPTFADVKILTPNRFKGCGMGGSGGSFARIRRNDFLYWVLSLNKEGYKFWEMKYGHFSTIGDFIAVVSYIFKEDFHQRLKTYEKHYADDIKERMDLIDLQNLVSLTMSPVYIPEEIEIKSWKDLMIKQKARAFHPHAIYYNPFFYHYKNKDVHKSKLIESSTEKVEDFLDTLYEVSPEVVKRYVEKVEIDEDVPDRWAYVFVHPKLKQCIKDAYWSREVCLISASDTVRSKLKYDKDCVMRLAEELEKHKEKV